MRCMSVGGRKAALKLNGFADGALAQAGLQRQGLGAEAGGIGQAQGLALGQVAGLPQQAAEYPPGAVAVPDLGDGAASGWAGLSGLPGAGQCAP